jgi:hypothetical protein
MQQDPHFKSISSLREEIDELGKRFKRFVSKISSIEEYASNLEYELSDLQVKLQDIASGNKNGFAPTRRITDTIKEPGRPDGSCIAPEDLTAKLRPLPFTLHGELDEFFNLVVGLGKRYRDLVSKINNLDDSASNIFWALSGIQERIMNLINSDLPQTGKHGLVPVSLKQRTHKHLLDTLIRSAESGIVSFSAKRFANGCAEFEIEGSKLTLSPRLADLLIALSEDVGQSDDDLVGWKTIAEISQLMLIQKYGPAPKNPSNREKEQHAVQQSIHRLHNQFWLAKINPFLIQRNSKLGYRLALKRASGERHESINNQDSRQIGSA